MSAPTSAVEAARTTACGVKRYGEASWAAATLRGTSVETREGSATQSASHAAGPGPAAWLA
ncbi:hypothetical protein PV703_32960, partial [Streptomyces sp. ME01-24h]|nr:hypothetical protein [Streptomyces sp. ME01-24h]